MQYRRRQRRTLLEFVARKVSAEEVTVQVGTVDVADETDMSAEPALNEESIAAM
jgi:hypothetical protein